MLTHSSTRTPSHGAPFSTEYVSFLTITLTFPSSTALTESETVISDEIIITESTIERIFLKDLFIVFSSILYISKGKIKSLPFLEGTTNETIQTKSLYRYGRLHLFLVQDLQNPRLTDSDLTYGNAKYSNDCCFGFSPNSLLSTLQDAF